MGVRFNYAKKTAKLGTKLLIPLLVIDTAWALIRYLLFHTTFNHTIPDRFVTIESIITNSIFTSFLIVLTIGMTMFAIYYSKQSKLGIYACVLLISFIGIKIAFIFFRFTQVIGNFYTDYMTNTFHVFEMVTAFLLIFAYIVYDNFQGQLKRTANIGYGHSPFPYLFGFIALVYPISNIIQLAGIDIAVEPLFSILRSLAFAASILEIIVYFDLLRRFDFMQSLDTVPEKTAAEEEKKE
jgi:hypothetical protein